MALVTVMCFRQKLTPFISGNGFGRNVIDSYFSLLNLSFVKKKYHFSIFTTFAKQSMINRLSNPINRNHSAAKTQCLLTWSRKIKLFEPTEGIFRDPTKYWTTKNLCKIGPLGPTEKISFFSFFLMRKRLSSDQKWFLRPQSVQPSSKVAPRSCPRGRVQVWNPNT